MHEIKKIANFTDIHFGAKSNETRHNIECLSFISWMITEAKKEGCDTCIFNGDWGHYRNTTQSTTLNYSLQGFELLNAAFKKVYVVLGNHDLFYKDKRDVNSIEFARTLPNIEIIHEITQINDDITLVPWLVGDEFKKLSSITTKYVFGHFEFPTFLMNAMVAMPDIGGINADMFKKEGQHLFSGHFHSRQIQTNRYGAKIEYIGNAFSHNFSDAGEWESRGFMMLELGKEPKYKSWPDAPKYITLTLSKLLEDPVKYLDNKTSARITVDTDISYEEAAFIKEMMIAEYNPRELSLIPYKEDIKEIGADANIKFESLDQIVIDHLRLVESSTMSADLLIDIYNNI